MVCRSREIKRLTGCGVDLGWRRRLQLEDSYRIGLQRKLSLQLSLKYVYLHPLPILGVTYPLSHTIGRRPIPRLAQRSSHRKLQLQLQQRRSFFVQKSQDIKRTSHIAFDLKKYQIPNNTFNLQQLKTLTPYLSSSTYSTHPRSKTHVSLGLFFWLDSFSDTRFALFSLSLLYSVSVVHFTRNANLANTSRFSLPVTPHSSFSFLPPGFYGHGIHFKFNFHDFHLHTCFWFPHPYIPVSAHNVIRKHADHTRYLRCRTPRPAFKCDGYQSRSNERLTCPSKLTSVASRRGAVL